MMPRFFCPAVLILLILILPTVAGSAENLQKIRIGFPSLAFAYMAFYVAQKKGLLKDAGLEAEFWLVAFSLLITIVHSSANAQSPVERLNVAYVSTGGGFAVTWIAKEANLFPKYGLDVQLIRIPGGPRLVQATIGGDVQFSHGSGVSTINAIARGADLALLAQTSRGYSGHLMVKPQYRALLDLRGAKIGVPQYGSTADLFLREGLKKWKLEPDKDVAILQAGGTTETFAALAGKRIDGAVLTTELALRAEKAGFIDLFNFQKLDIKEVGALLSAKRSFVVSNEDTTVKFLEAFVEAIYLYKTDKQLSLKVLKKYTRNDDPEILSAVREDYIDGMDPIPYPREDDLRGSMGRLLKELAKTGTKAPDVRPQDFVETKYLKKLEQSGFIKRISK